jgi:hypothetical protein
MSNTSNEQVMSNDEDAEESEGKKQRLAIEEAIKKEHAWLKSYHYRQLRLTSNRLYHSHGLIYKVPGTV